MRNAFVGALVEQAATDDRVFLLTGDLGWSVLEKFSDKYPDRFLNAGVAEQNMVGMATGLAQAGYVPFAYSIATFSSMRPYEQLRDGAILHQLPVRIVGVGGGYAYGHAGPTHFALEDLCIMRAQPGLTVIAPADPAQTVAVVQAIRDLSGPVYLRVGKGGNAPVPGLAGRFAFGRPEVVRDGKAVLFIATGAIALAAVAAAQALETEGISAAVAVQAHVGFSGSPELASLLARFPAIVSVEEGFAAGGLGSLVAETVAQAGHPCRVKICGVTRPIAGISGGAEYMQALAGLSPGALAAEARALLSRR